MRMHLIVLTVVMSALAPEIPAAQGPGGGRGQRPPRDAVQPTERGTASISGRVVAADTARPINRARVLVSGAGAPRTALTDETGRFNITALPAGTYRISASKAGFVDAAFGQRRTRSDGTPIPVVDGQQITKVDLALSRGAVITGHVLDEGGEPLARAIVQVLRHQYQRGEKRLIPVGGDRTDDRGQYRVFGLPPGDYVVSATSGSDGFLRRTLINPTPANVAFDDPPENTGYAPTYYPGVVTAADASRLKVAAAQELSGIDFQLQLVQLAAVRGTVLGGAGSVVLIPDESAGPPRMGTLRTRVDADGTFVMANVSPGRYTAVARSEGTSGPGTVTAMQPLVVAGQDVAVTLSPMKPARVSGTATFESAATAPPSTLTGFRVIAQPLGPAPGTGRPNRSSELSGGPQFALELLPGEYLVQASAAGGWTMKHVYLDGRDVTDQPIDVKAGDTITGLNIIFTDRISSLAGVVRAGNDAAVAGTTVIAFPADEKQWRPQTRKIRTAQTDPDGTFRLNNLPPGEYLLVATDDVEQGEWFDPAFLEAVRDKGVRVTLAEGEQKMQTLKAS
jgi:Carboxypeptidase regulatory-like domain